MPGVFPPKGKTPEFATPAKPASSTRSSSSKSNKVRSPSLNPPDEFPLGRPPNPLTPKKHKKIRNPDYKDRLDQFVACYHIVWTERAGEGVQEGYSGATFEFRKDERKELFGRYTTNYKVTFQFGVHEATFSCVATTKEEEMFSNFKFISANYPLEVHMKEFGLDYTAFKFKFEEDTLDDEGFPFLAWHTDCAGYLMTKRSEFGWAKRMCDRPLSTEESERLKNVPHNSVTGDWDE